MTPESKSAPVPPTKPARRRFTVEERIALRLAEVETLKAKQIDRIRERFAEVVESIRVLGLEARAAEMATEAYRCSAALEAMTKAESKA